MRSSAATTLDEVEAAARRRGVWVDTDAGESGGEGAILVIAHQALWALVHNPAPVIGWVAVRLDRHQYEIPGTAGWLGAADCDADQILANLLDHDQLPTDLFGRQPPVPTVHPYALEDPQSAYLHCPACEHIAPGEDADYALTGDGRADLAEPVIVTCSVCGYRTDARPYAVTRTHPHRCPPCQAITQAPAVASHVTCRCCRRRFVPDAVDETCIGLLPATTKPPVHSDGLRTNQ
jgi:hypothetical protein